MITPEKKIFLEKTQDLEYAVHKLIEAEADRIILNVPKDSVLGKSLNNFQVLKREAETAEKEIFIESIDDHILELSSISGIEANNPVFRSKERAVADILPRGNLKSGIRDIRESFEREELGSPKKFLKKKKELVKSPVFRSDEGPLPEEKIFEPSSGKDVKRKKISFRRLMAIVIALVLLLGGVRVALVVMPHASVKITLKKTSVNFKEAIEVSSKIKEANISNGRVLVPGEFLIAEKNMNRLFKASAKERVEAKAAGGLVVYNAYSSQPQTLVAQTRFESPDKKIFRLTKQVTIPGAKIDNGKIIPSKIEVAVIAEESGEAYNLVPSTPWRIPGFKGSPRYEGFYAESVSPMAGGFIGERAAPTSADLEAARNDLKASLNDALRGEMAVLISDAFKVFEDAEVFKILEEKIDTSSGETPETFNLFLRGELRRVIFENTTLEEAVASKARKGLPDGLRYSDFKVEYGKREFDSLLGRIRFEATGSLVFENDIKAEDVSREIMGKDEKSLQSLIFSLPGLEKATISLSPFWVKRVPENEKKIKIEID